MKTSELLIKAKAEIKDPKHWTKGALCRDKDGYDSVSAESPYAVCWCSVGSLYKAADGQPNVFTLASKGRDVLKESMPYGDPEIDIPDYNDLSTTTHADIMQMFDKAIATAIEEEKQT